MRRLWLLPLLAVVGVFFVLATSHVSAQTPDEPVTLNCAEAGSLYCPASSDTSLRDTLANLAAPNVKGPPKRTVTYDVTTRGTITANFADFKKLASETLNDARGWSRLDIGFTEVASGGQFTLVLAEAGQVPSFGSPCDSDWSCQSGRYVIINQTRWLNASPAWNSSGGSLRDYQHMVVNHETGHWLGHGHATCSGVGQSASVMQQQSINLAGCKFNPWPLGNEIHSSRLGI
jgi:hypothetical protein